VDDTPQIYALRVDLENLLFKICQLRGMSAVKRVVVFGLYDDSGKSEGVLLPRLPRRSGPTDWIQSQQQSELIRFESRPSSRLRREWQTTPTPIRACTCFTARRYRH
jgi:hypothetical protein